MSTKSLPATKSESLQVGQSVTCGAAGRENCKERRLESGKTANVQLRKNLNEKNRPAALPVENLEGKRNENGNTADRTIRKSPIKKKNVDLWRRRSKLFEKERGKMEQQQTILCKNSKKNRTAAPQVENFEIREQKAKQHITRLEKVQNKKSAKQVEST